MHNVQVFFCLLAFAFIVGNNEALRLTNMTAPTIQDPRKDMQLYCKFDMGGEDLYAVKWYKDDHEFFRYVPAGKSNYIKYNVPGVSVDSRRSHCTRETCELTLVSLVRPYSSGAYRCEVSSEAPAFRLASQTHNITVAALPTEHPIIEGLNDNYLTGELIQATCTSGLGDPKPHLTWYVNKQPVPFKSIKELNSSVLNPHDFYHEDKVKLKRTTLQLRLPLDKKLTGKDPSSSLEVKCVSTADGINPSIAPPLAVTRNIMILDQNQLVNNQKLHWPDSSATIHFPKFVALCALILLSSMC